MTSYMHGATGCPFLRWRPLLDGTLFGVLGQFYEELLAFGGRKPRFTVSDKRIRARLHRGDGGDCLWIANARKGVDIPVIIEAGKGSMENIILRKELWW